ncbi:YesL family protein [Evansella tamaricis]|uniref:DUF624 domain-containing protein n=1 Tax=Evansella tamaricis TaxID=2069301 RepID=A0ABS6JK29_9BACI|nr:DUF624 domain-containing protein [Evansella tamaricis]MBU9712673.1 DUF624 domain-containing protein [Evansella tamaricis]
MQRNLGFSGLITIIADWIMKLSVLNIVWMITNLPILFIAFLMIFSPSDYVLAVLTIPLVIFLPIVFFPGTTAMFATVREWVMKKEQPSIIKSYLSHLKDNYIQSMWSGLGLTGLWVVWALDYFFFRTRHDLLAVVFLLIGVLLIIFTINYFCISVHYHMGKREMYKNAFYITVGSPLLLITLISANILVIYLSARFLFLIPFFTVSLIVLLSYLAFYQFTLKVEKKLTETK